MSFNTTEGNGDPGEPPWTNNTPTTRPYAPPPPRPKGDTATSKTFYELETLLYERLHAGINMYQWEVTLSTKTKYLKDIGGDDVDVGFILSEVARQGWELITANITYIKTGEGTSDKIFGSGQHVYSKGFLRGTYLLRHVS